MSRVEKNTQDRGSGLTQKIQELYSETDTKLAKGIGWDFNPKYWEGRKSALLLMQILGLVAEKEEKKDGKMEVES